MGPLASDNGSLDDAEETLRRAVSTDGDVIEGQDQ